jgi:oligopeptidase B
MQKTPKPKKIAKVSYLKHDVITDFYSWMRDSNWPSLYDKEIIMHLENENNYSISEQADNKEMKEKLFHELKGRIVLEDKSVPIKKNEYLYFQYTLERSEYKIYARNLIDTSSVEILLNPNDLIGESKYLRMGCINISNDHKRLAYSFETDGTERYTLNLKNFGSDKECHEVLKDVAAEIVWNNESSGFFYTKRNPNWKVLEVWYHSLGSTQENDSLIYREEDQSFEVNIKCSASKRYIFIISENNDTTECRYIDLVNNELEPKLIQGRKLGHIYYPEHFEEYFYFRTNDIHSNFRITKQKIDTLPSNDWLEVLPAHNERYLTNFYFAESFYVVTSRFEGLNKFCIFAYDDLLINELKFKDSCYSANLIPLTYVATEIRIRYSALNRPETIIDFKYDTNFSEIKKTAIIPSGFIQEHYTSERIYAHSRDGKKIPISILYRKDLFNKDGTNPLYLYGYGAYGLGSATTPSFNSNLLSLIDRGFIYAVAHIRGGDELGRIWYEEGRLLNKRNTFNDFEDSLKHLINEKYTKEKKVIISGTSAGGLLIGFALNEYPSLLGGAIAKVPFVDVLNTMLDDNLPLTVLEYTEWGNPKEKEYYDYIKGYSPYDNVKKQDYPPIYVTAGINDPRVTYWEPAKWVAKLREYKTDNNAILFNIDFGHSGNSGRFAHLEDIASEYSFILRTLNIKV